jgi:branched-chain amino acid transport system substrate-binding protein
MKNIKFCNLMIGLFGLICLIALNTPGAALSAEKEKGPIKLGWICNYNFIVHKETLAAVKLAVEEINKKGGILGRPVVLLEEDDRGQVPQAVAAYKKLVMTERCRWLLLGEGTEVSLANQETGASLYKEYPHIAITVGSAAPEVTLKIADNYEKYKFFFRHHHNVINTNMDFYVDAVTDIMKKHGLKKLAHIEEDAAWNKASREGGYGRPSMKDMFKQKGIDVVYYGVISIQEKMFLPILEKIAASGAEFINTQCAYTDMATFAKQWAVSAAKNVPPHFTAAGGCNILSFWGRTDGACLGVIIAEPEGNFAITPRTVPILKTLREKFNVGPTWMTGYAYEAVYMVKRAIEKANGIEDLESVIKSLEAVEIPKEESYHGRVKYGTERMEKHGLKTGPGYYNYPIGQWQGKDKMVIFWPPDLAKKVDPGKAYVSPERLRKMGK